MNAIEEKTNINSPALWKGALKIPGPTSNKYSRGHVLILGGPVMCGAARLAAMGARRSGAGLVTIVTPESAFNIYASATDPGCIVIPFGGLDDFNKIISDERKNVVVLGPGAGDKGVGEFVLSTLKSDKDVVLDADGLNAFQENPEKLFQAIKKSKGTTIITPHGGEFVRLFPDLAKSDNKKSEGEKLEITLKAAKLSSAVVVFKGSDTIIASPDGAAVINSAATPWLATAGSGDVLAGMIGAMLAQGMDGLDAASSAVWMHARAGGIFGPGIVAEDIAQTMPAVWAELLSKNP